ncbi:Uncharacterized protein PB7E8.01 [Choanephora cucurbitarum]|uniref:Uncharacterized protein PB7E8.01 n=1 Tax=Choanephora cucurbitarum TaxID=101091 RepID=A0A1C7NRL7_9FUNG|nr:Uncharacterized protein PB7E8.01 [Choanephora cucurbitarum]
MLKLVSAASFANSYCIKHSNNPDNDVIAICTGSQTKSLSEAVLTDSTISSNRIHYDLKCSVSTAECASVKETIDAAIDAISSTFRFEVPLYINVSFADFCQSSSTCQYNLNRSIAATYPSASYAMVDSTDNVVRLYPQALLKQFTNLAVKPNWAEYDMNVQLNSKINWYFVNDSQDIQSDQVDLFLNVIHEIIHGLGFMTSWSDNLYSRLQPLITDGLNRFVTPISLAKISNNDIMKNSEANMPFWGFAEYAFDKLLYFVDSNNSTKPLSSITTSLNSFANSNTSFNSLLDFANSWYKSGEYKTASDVYTKAVTGFDILAMVNNEPVFYLETFLNPFSSGSSLCHVDHAKYASSAEYLMVYVADKGFNRKKFEVTFPGGPVGPSLLRFVSGLGYALNATHNLTPTRPPLTYWGPSQSLVNTPSNPSPIVSVDSNGPAHLPTARASDVSTSNAQALKYDRNWLLILLLSHFLQLIYFQL